MESSPKLARLTNDLNPLNSDIQFQLSLLRLISSGGTPNGPAEEMERLLNRAPAAN
jgi:hypothetical protein